MWLINSRNMKLEFMQNPKKNSYAILSHTWGDDEVSFQEYRQYEQGRAPGHARTGLEKIIMTCQLALTRGLAYCWVDTCCIDKSSSAELSEAINSMFQWYKDAAVCFAYLSDVRAGDSFGRAFAASRWLKRGWTLQELIAPRNVEFYDAAWSKRSSKAESLTFLSNCTGIDREVLEDCTNLSRIPIARRMSWASMRKTTRIEDTAYCLMGIFDIHMPMIYGEGKKAFMRLQEEIAKQSCDLSLFAWTSNIPPELDEPEEDRDERSPEGIREEFRGAFARSPREFYYSGNLNRGQMGGLMDPEFTITNKGVRITTALVESDSMPGESIWNLGIRQAPQTDITDPRGWMGVYLAKTPLGYVRSHPERLYVAGDDARTVYQRGGIYIRRDLNAADQAALESRFFRSIHIGSKPPGALVVDVMPKDLFDPVWELFLHQAWGINAYVKFDFPCCPHGRFEAVVGCSTIQEPVCRVWTEQDEVFKSVMQHMNFRTQLSDYVAVDYFRAYFLDGGGSKGGADGSQTTISTTHFRCNQFREHQVKVTARLVAGEYQNTEVFSLDVFCGPVVEDSVMDG